MHTHPRRLLTAYPEFWYRQSIYNGARECLQLIRKPTEGSIMWSSDLKLSTYSLSATTPGLWMRAYQPLVVKIKLPTVLHQLILLAYLHVHGRIHPCPSNTPRFRKADHQSARAVWRKRAAYFGGVLRHPPQPAHISPNGRTPSIRSIGWPTSWLTRPWSFETGQQDSSTLHEPGGVPQVLHGFAAYGNATLHKRDGLYVWGNRHS